LEREILTCEELPSCKFVLMRVAASIGLLYWRRARLDQFLFVQTEPIYYLRGCMTQSGAVFSFPFSVSSSSDDACSVTVTGGSALPS